MDRVPRDHLGLVCYDEARKGTARPKYVEKSLRKEKSTTTNSHQGRHMGVVATTYVLIAKVHKITDRIHQNSKDSKKIHIGDYRSRFNAQTLREALLMNYALIRIG